MAETDANVASVFAQAGQGAAEVQMRTKKEYRLWRRALVLEQPVLAPEH